MLEKTTSPLVIAAQERDIDKLNSALSNNPSTQDKAQAMISLISSDVTQQPYHYTISEEAVPLITQLVKSGTEVNFSMIPTTSANPYTERESFLQIAYQSQHRDLAIELIKRGAYDENVFHDAAIKGDMGIAEALLTYKATLTTTRCLCTPQPKEISSIHALETMLCTAAEHGHTTLVNRLLEASGLNINTRNQEYLTPLDLATRANHPETIALLTEKGGNYSFNFYIQHMQGSDQDREITQL